MNYADIDYKYATIHLHDLLDVRKMPSPPNWIQFGLKANLKYASFCIKLFLATSWHYRKILELFQPLSMR